MATKRKRKSVKRLSSPALLSRRSPKRKTARRKRRGLSSNIPVIGSLSLTNPMIGAPVGAMIGMFLKNQIPDDLFKSTTDTDPKSLRNVIQPYIKAAVIAGAGVLAKKAKYPEVAGGLFAVAAVLAVQKLNVPGLSSGGSFRRTNYVNPSLLSENIYPSYMPLYDQALLSNG
jgi:hypothetical protein